MENNTTLEKLEGLVSRFEEVATLITDPAVIADQERYVKLTREYKDLSDIMDARKRYIACLNGISEAKDILANESDPEMKEMAREELALNEEEQPKIEEEIKMLLVPKDPEDSKNVQMEIRAGAGGDEAALFAGDIFQMYKKYCDSKGWTLSITSVSEGAVGGFKEIDFAVSGDNVYGTLKYESGVHRVQRVPETESGGRIHTSTASVAVLPEAEEVDEIDIPDKDIRIDVMRASGNGGQCVNTTDSAVRLTHIPTGIVIYSQTEKSQLQNKAKAFALLRTKLLDIEMQKRHDAEADLRKSQVGTGDRSEKIRTYNFPQGRVTDHRIGLTLYKLDKIMNGDIQEIIDACIAADQAAKLAKMNEE